jgi:S-disulfanyl-L-cysteine oxidoreductase SoxD
MRSFRFAVPVVVLAGFSAGWAQTQSPTYQGVGRTPTEAEIRALDIAVGTDGKELPPGRGTAPEGAKIYAEKCATCHGASQEGTPLGPALVGGKGTLTTLHPAITIGAYWPFATTIFDYIRRAMPRSLEGSLSPNEVYSLAAFLLYRNAIIKESDVIDAKTLPKVQMPNRFGFVPPNLEDIHDIKKRGCRVGNCP